MFMAGVVMLVFGAAGLFGSGGASYSKMKTANPKVFYGQLLVGVLLLSAGVALLTG